MSDIIKDPIQVNPNGAPQPAKSNNTGLIIVIVVVVIMFFLPIAATYGFVYYFVNFFEEHMDDYNPKVVNHRLSEEESEMFQHIWIASQDGDQSTRGLTRSDCLKLQNVSNRVHLSIVGDEGVAPFSFCSDGYLQAKVDWNKDSDEYKFSLRSDHDACIEITLQQDFKRVVGFYSGSSVNVDICKDLINIPVAGAEVPEGNEGVENDEAPFTDNRIPSSGSGVTKTNRV